MPNFEDLAEEKLTQLLDMYPEIRNRYNSGDESFCAALEDFCFNPDTDLSNFNLKSIYTDTRWHVANTGDSVVHKIKQPVRHTYSRFKKDDSLNSAFENIKQSETIAVRRNLKQFLDAQPDLHIDISRRPALLENYFRSYCASSGEAFADVISDLDALQCAIDLDSSVFSLVQEHPIFSNWGADYEKFTSVSQPSETSEPESIAIFDGLPQGGIVTTVLQPPQLADNIQTFSATGYVPDEEAEQAPLSGAMGVFGFLKAHQVAPDLEDDDDDEFEDDPDYDEDDFESEEVLEDDSEDLDTTSDEALNAVFDDSSEEDEIFDSDETDNMPDFDSDEDEEDEEDESIYLDSDSDDNFEEVDSNEDDLDEDFYEEVEENLDKFTMTDVYDLGIPKPKVVNSFTDDYDIYMDISDDDDEDDEQYDDEVYDDFEFEEQADDTDEEVYEDDDSSDSEESYDEDTFDSEDDIYDVDEQDSDSDDIFDDNAFEESYIDDQVDSEDTEDIFDDDEFEESYTEDEESSDIEEDSEAYDEEEYIDSVDDDFSEDSDTDSDDYDEVYEDSEIDSDDTSYDDMLDDSDSEESYDEIYESSDTDSEDDFDEDDFDDEVYEDSSFEEASDSDEFDDFEDNIDDEIYEDTSDTDSEEYDEDSFEDDEEIIDETEDELDWGDNDLASSIEPDEYDDDELGLDQFNTLAREAGIDVYADPSDAYDTSHATAPGTEDFGLSPNVDYKKTPVTKEEKNDYTAKMILNFVNGLRNAPSYAKRLFGKVFFKEGD